MNNRSQKVTKSHKVRIDLDQDLKERTANGIREKAEKKAWSLRKTVCDDLDERYKRKFPVIQK